MTAWERAPPLRRVAWLVGLAASYVLAGKLGLLLAFVHPNASAVWPPTGIALAGLMLLGTRAWPAVFLAAFAVNLSTAGTVPTSLAIATGNTLEAVIGVVLISRWAGGLRVFTRTRNTLRFILLAACVAPVIAATVGVTALALTGRAAWGDYRPIWLTWWTGDAVSALVVMPVVLLWSIGRRPQWNPRRLLDFSLLVVTLVLAGVIVFGGIPPFADRRYPLDFAFIPVLLLAAFRFGARAAATTMLLISALAVSATLQGIGPFVGATSNESLVLLQAFTAVAAAMTLIVAAAVAERRRAETHLRSLAATDPLTGLADYRQLMAVLETEVRRSQRTQRPFALLFLDMDGLKDINDRHGHLAGNQALYRLALVLRHACRAVDTPARFGGDEFAIVLPEADEAAARQLAHRITDRLALQTEGPAISVSLGVALFGRDGETAEALLHYADNRLYAVKRARHAAER